MRDVRSVVTLSGQRALLYVDEQVIRMSINNITPPPPGAPLLIRLDQHHLPKACDVTIELRTRRNEKAPLGTCRVAVPDGAPSILARFDRDELAAAGVTTRDYRRGLIFDVLFHSGGWDPKEWKLPDAGVDV